MKVRMGEKRSTENKVGRSKAAHLHASCQSMSLGIGIQHPTLPQKKEEMPAFAAGNDSI